MRLFSPSPNSTHEDDATHQEDALDPEPQHPPAADGLYQTDVEEFAYHLIGTNLQCEGHITYTS